MAKARRIKYRADTVIGYAAAEDDEAFLFECFIPTADSAVLNDTQSPKCILLGRTGVGKTASLIHLRQTQENVIEIEPESLALHYIENSDIIQFFTTLGVKLDIFYQLLWRHILAVQLLRYRFHIDSESEFQRFKNWLFESLGANKPRRIAIEYLERWSSNFWEETESRIKEITNKLETELRGSTNLATLGVPLNAAASSKVTKSEKSEIVHKAQRVVNEIQMQQLGEVIRLLSENIFSDPKKTYFVIIDRLDERWVDDPIRYNLIRALIESIKSFRKIHNVKIIVAIRTDLLDRVYRHTADAGFQQEKYEDLNIRIKWNREELLELVDKRINLVMQQQYTKQDVGFYDIFPKKIGEDQTHDYILGRTLLRPRDAIAFVNTVFEQAGGRTQISAKIVRDAEGIYSDRRLRALEFEWQVEHPQLAIYMDVLRKRGSRFPYEDVTKEHIESLIVKLLQVDAKKCDLMTREAELAFDGRVTWGDFKNELFRNLYKVGAIGVRLPAFERTTFIEDGPPDVTAAQVAETPTVTIHPMLWRALGVHRPRSV